MKRIRNHHSIPVMALLALTPLAALAIPASNGAIAIDCGHRYISQRDAARVMKTDNLSQAYAKRMTLYANVARVCHSGVKQVLLVTEADPGSKKTLASR